MDNKKILIKKNCTPRNSSIELLRIISMFIIVFHHFAVHGGFEWDSSCLSVSRFWYNLIVMGGKVGVDVFVLISGYFMVSNKWETYDFKRILKYWGQVLFYSLSIYLILGFLGKSNLEIRSLKNACFPITYSTWWFASTYFVLYLIHPFLNKLLNSLDKKIYQSLLVVLVICWSIIPTFTMQAFEGNRLLWFITLYAISGYASIYGFNSKFTTKHYFVLWMVFSILTYLSSIMFTILGTRWEIFSLYTTYFYGQDKLSVLLISLSLFMTFVTLKMKYHKWINVMASATFGVYLIHDHNNIRTLLWSNLFKNNQYQDSLLIIPYSVLVVASVYILCTLIDLLRQKIFEPVYMRFLNKYIYTLLRPLKIVYRYCKDIVFGK